jgi:hypothetical protein
LFSHNSELQKSPGRILRQFGGNSLDISKVFFQVGMLEFDPCVVSQAVLRSAMPPKRRENGPTPDARLVGAAPLPPHRQPTSADIVSQEMLNKPDPEDAAFDRKIGNICRDCSTFLETLSISFRKLFLAYWRYQQYCWTTSRTAGPRVVYAAQTSV